MTDLDHLARLRGLFHTGEIPLARPDCLSAETISALTDGTIDAETRAQALKHIAGCAACRRAVASVAEALADGPVTREIELVEGKGRARRFGRGIAITVPLAAAATVVLLLARSPTIDIGGHRGGSGTGPTAPVPVAPVGTVAAAHALIWTRVPDADGYRVTLFNAVGAVAYEAQAADTAAALPDSVALAVGRPYLWKVEARIGFDRWIASALVEFSLAPPSP